MTISWTNFATGGASCMAAAMVTNPIDVIKTRLQLQGELAKAGAAPVKYRGFGHGLLVVAREEGLRGLYKGIVPSLLREGSYSTIRMGLYEPFRTLFSGDNPKPSLLAKIAAGAAAGATGAAIANPTDLVKVRMQAQSSSHQYRGTWHAFVSIYTKEGLPGLYRGVGPTVQRAMLLTATQLASYDSVKHALLDIGEPFRDNMPLHLLVSMIAGLFCATTTAPVDTIKSRYMNQPFDVASGKGLKYSSTLDCLAKTVRAEGLRGLYKGWFPNWMRIGPHTIVTFIIYEQLRRLVGVKPI